MNRRRLILIAGVLILGTAEYVATIPSPPPDPVYQGRHLSEWLPLCGLNLHDWQWKEIGARPEDAIHALGTNALPMIVSELRVRDSKLRMWLWERLYEHDKEAWMRDPAWYSHDQALMACRYLGTNAATVVPLVVNLLSKDVSWMSRQKALEYLEYLGPKASPAIPTLESAVRKRSLVSVDRWGRTNDYAALALEAIHGKSVDATAKTTKEPVTR